jgi:hypothetical protein
LARALWPIAVQARAVQVLKVGLDHFATGRAGVALDRRYLGRRHLRLYGLPFFVAPFFERLGVRSCDATFAPLKAPRSREIERPDIAIKCRNSI